MGLRVTETTFRGGGGGAGSSGHTKHKRKTRRTFLVEYDADSPPASLSAVEYADDGTTAIPGIDDADAVDTARVVISVDVTPRADGAGLVFDVVVEYETPEGEAAGENPLTVPVDYDWDFSASSKPYFEDETPSTPLLGTTSAGEPYENFLEREEGEVVVTITDNIAASAWDPLLAAEYMADPSTAINDGAMTIDGISIGTGQARMGGIKCSGIKTSNSIDYRTRVIVIKLRESWDQVVEDRGFHEKYTDGGVVKLREIVKGTPPVKVEKPYPLDGSGAKKTNATDTPATRTHKPYPSKDFDVWGIT